MDTSQTQPQPNKTRTSERFCDPDADVTFVSSDNIVFKIHGNQLTTHSAGFAIQNNTSIGTELVHLQEPSAILEILFQFIEPPSEVELYRQPSVIDMDPDIFFAVAEAAEKYVVHGAMNVFVTRMHSLLGHHSIDVLNHCGKHGYNDLANQAAEQTLFDCSFTVVASKLTAPGLLVKWMKYYDRFLAVGKLGDKAFISQHNNNCNPLLHKHLEYLRQVATSPRLAATPPPERPGPRIACNLGSPRCQCYNTPWIKDLQTEVDSIPKFSDIPD